MTPTRPEPREGASPQAIRTHGETQALGAGLLTAVTKALVPTAEDVLAYHDSHPAGEETGWEGLVMCPWLHS